MNASSTTGQTDNSGVWILHDAAVFTVFYALFFYILKSVSWTDFNGHSQIIHDQLARGEHFAVYMALPRYAFQFLRFITSGFGGQLGDETGCFVLMLSLAVYVKYFFTRRMFGYFIPGCGELSARLYAFSLSFAAPLALGADEKLVHRYIATLPTACWHNTTIIFCTAFSVALFWYMVRWFKDGYQTGDFCAMCFFLVLSALSKPSYLFAFLPTYGIVALLCFPPQRSRRALLVIPVLLAVAFLCITAKQMEHFKVAVNGGELRAYGQGVYWAPFEYYLHYLKNARTLIAVHASSVLFPLLTGLYLAVRNVKKIFPARIVVTGTVLQFAFGLLCAYLLNIGSDFDRWHGNMTWQILACNYIVFTMCVIALLRIQARAAARILLGFYGLHVLSGFIFVVEMFRTKAGWVDPLIGWWTKSG